MPRLFGVSDRPADRLAIQAEMGMLPLAQAYPGMMARSVPADILLFKAWSDVLGDYPDYPAQQIGDCTSFGNGHGLDLLQCVEAATQGVEYFEVCTEALYAAGREVAGMLRSGDGCYCGGVVKAAMTLGTVRRKDVGAYSGTRAKQWGRTGMPSEVRDLAAKVKLGSGVLVTSAAEVDAALASGNPVPIASTCGFEGNGGFQRDSKGICYAGGSWPHNMLICGRISSDGTDTYVIAQSWGNADPEGPCPFDMPKFCFRALRSTVERYMIPAQDCYAISAYPGFAKKDLPSHWTNGGFA